MIPPYRPVWELIVCRDCGRRIYDDDGRPIHRWWWDWWPSADKHRYAEERESST